ncbi:PEGA domain-containing protein [candidate division WOR-3 bacterium]|uniref:PEGA domain-containing protein n=1 Tax=candidate division WOR-3 bacterium TaxID=2052148 RepID=A0A9D5QEH8_UNCW3|nr:PEGA domain-containing protein [candidate division WOR-3 bacterium]MBD3365055.1 PEGA domain-containing protein [candidate division WOR-3 bacterium]
MNKLLLTLGVAAMVLGMVFCEPEPTTGAIAVNSTPTGAAISLDGSSTGKITNAILTEIEEGSHDITLTLADHKDTTVSVTVVAGDTATVDIELEVDAYGNLYVTSNPTGAAIWLDDENTLETTDHLFTDLEVGDYTVKLTLDQYDDYETIVEIKADETDTVDADLEMKTGRIQVNSDPDGAAISLDGISTGQVTDALLEDVDIGERTIGLSKSGYADTSVSVTVTDDETANVDITLVEQQEEIELSADDATSAGWGFPVTDKEHKVAVKLTPPSYPFTITKAVYITIVWAGNPDPWEDPGDAVFFTPGFSGAPSQEIGRKQVAAYTYEDWNVFDVSSEDMVISSGSFFFALELTKDYSTLGYPAALLDAGTSLHHAGWAYTSFTSPDSDWVGWLAFDNFGMGGDWPSGMTLGDSVDVIMRVRGTIPGGYEVELMPDGSYESVSGWPLPKLPGVTVSTDNCDVDCKAINYDFRNYR